MMVVAVACAVRHDYVQRSGEVYSGLFFFFPTQGAWVGQWAWACGVVW
jgi:hypothetical protein